MVQSFPPPTSTMTMLQTRSSSSEPFQNGSQGQQHPRNPQMPRNIYNTSVGGMTTGNYRGQTTTSPISPHGFQNAPILQNGHNPLRQHPTAPPYPRLENRTSSAPSIPITLHAQQQNFAASNRPWPSPVSQTFGTANAFTPQQTPRDDGSGPTNHNTKQPNPRPLSSLDLNPSTLQAPSYATVAKSSPDRYRRNHRRAETSGGLPSNASVQDGSSMPSGSGMAAVGKLYTQPSQTNSTPSLTSYRGTASPNVNVNDHNPAQQLRVVSKDDSNLQRERQATSDLAKRYRRRSISSLEAKDYAMSEAPAPLPSQQPAQPKTYAAMLAGPSAVSQGGNQDRREVRATPAVEQPTSIHRRNGSTESNNSVRSASKTTSVSTRVFLNTFSKTFCKFLITHPSLPTISCQC